MHKLSHPGPRPPDERVRWWSAARVAWIGLSSLAMALLATPAWAEFEPPIAVTGARLVTGTGETLDDATIVIRDGRFERVGTGVEIPSDAELIDATGLIAYSGFLDAHSHAGMPDVKRPVEERRRVEDEPPDLRDNAQPATERANRRGIHPEYQAWRHVDTSDTALDPYRSVGFTTALVAPKSGILAGYGAVLELSGLPARRAARDPQAAMHASFRPGEPGDYPTTLLGVFAHLRQVIADARWYAETRAYVERHPRTGTRLPADPALEALQPVLRGRVPLVFEADTENEIHRVLDLSEELGLSVIISGAREAYKLLDRIVAARVPLIVSLKFDEEPEYGKRNSAGPEAPDTQPAASPQRQDRFEGEFDKGRYSPARVLEEKRRQWDEHLANAIRLHRAGVRFALTTRGFDKPDGFFDNLNRVIEAGLPVEAALEALTVNPAAMFNMDDQLGTVEPGSVANLVLRTAPLGDKNGRVRWLFVEGKKFDVRPLVEAGKKNETAETGADIPQARTASAPAHPPSPDAGRPQWRCEIEDDRTPATRTGGSVLITNANILTGTGETIEGSDILVANGKIELIDKELKPPVGVRTIDAGGGWVVPGFIDAHSHIASDAHNEASRSVAAEVRIADVLDPKHIQVFRALAGGVTTIHTMHGSANPIGGRNVVLKLKYGRPASDMIVRDAARTIKFALGENVTQAGSCNRAGKRFPGSRMGVERVMRHALIAAGRYQAEWKDYRERTQRGEDVAPPRTDLRLEALADVVSGDLIIHCHCYRADEILRMIAVAEDFGLRIGLLHHVLEGYRIAPELARHGCGASTFADLWSYKLEAYNATPYNAALLTAYGVCTSVNSDSANRMRYLNLEAAKCIRWGGLTNDEALRLITLNPARQLGIAHRTGTIQVGKDADLAIFDGHPFNIYSKCVMTLIEGEVYFEHRSPKPHARTGPIRRPVRIDRSIPASPHRLYAIVGATVHPISAPPIDNATVLIRNERILEIGTDVTVPPGAGVVRGEGLHVYPGLIDAGSSIGLVEISALKVSVDDRDLARFQPDLRAASAFNPHSAHVRIARAVGITAALSKPAGGIVSGRSALLHLDGWTTTEMIVRDPVALHVSLPALPIDVPTKDRETEFTEHKKKLREIDEFFRRAGHYARVVERPNTGPVAPDTDPVLEAMRPYVLGHAPVIFAASTYKEITRAVEFAERHRLRCVISGGDQAWKLAETLAEKNIPVILQKPSNYPRGEFEPWDSVFACASVLAEAGVEFCFASGHATRALDLPFEAGLAVAHGLSPQRAIHALTLGAATILGVEDRIGSIEPGKIADLVVTSGDPLQPLTRVTHVFINGRPVDLDNKHRAAYETFRTRPAPNLPPPGDLRGPPSLTSPVR